MRPQILAETDNTRPFNLIPLVRVVEKNTDQAVVLKQAVHPK
ncbi:MAG: hypothetical protein R3E89_17045 [Thiolinea sp.]